MKPVREQLAEQHPTQCRQVNNFIKRHHGVDPELRRADGYFYFASLYDQYESAVYVYRISSLSYQEWLTEYEQLKGKK
jgi:hypothetical protein